jgi:hypothetical protein
MMQQHLQQQEAASLDALHCIHCQWTSKVLAVVVYLLIVAAGTSHSHLQLRNCHPYAHAKVSQLMMHIFLLFWYWARLRLPV